MSQLWTVDEVLQTGVFICTTYAIQIFFLLFVLFIGSIQLSIVILHHQTNKRFKIILFNY